MTDKCIFQLQFACSDADRLQVNQVGSRLQSIMDASRIQHDELHVELDKKLKEDNLYQPRYHKACVSKYLINGKRVAEKRKKETLDPTTVVPEKKTRSNTGEPFDWLSQCFYCGLPCDVERNKKNPNRWIPAYLVRETDPKKKDGTLTDDIKYRIQEKCTERADVWATEVRHRLAGLTVRAADLHAADARYHRDCYARFFSDRPHPGDAKKGSSKVSQGDPLQSLVNYLKNHRTQQWDSVQLMKLYIELGGNPMKQHRLVKSVQEELQDLIVLSACGYRSIIFFKDNTNATLKMIKDEEEDNIDAALDMIAKHINEECSNIEYHSHTYRTKISKDIAAESSSYTLQQLLSRLSLDEQSLPSLLIGNMITSAIKKHPTPLQIALGIFFHRKKTVTHMYDYLVSCSYDELLRFKRSSAVAKYLQQCGERQIPVQVDTLVQIIIDNFDAELSSPNGLVSTHELALIETHSRVPSDTIDDTIPRINKTDMSKPIWSEEDDIVPYDGPCKPIPPPLMPNKLPNDFFEAQRIAYERANNQDFDFLKVVFNQYISGLVVIMQHSIQIF